MTRARDDVFFDFRLGKRYFACFDDGRDMMTRYFTLLLAAYL